VTSHLQLEETETPARLRAIAAQKRREDKERETASRMAPRPCKLPRCGQSFIPARVQDWKSEFCCPDHQKDFWLQANRLAAAVITRNEPSSFIPNSEFQPGVSHRAQVLAILERNVNQWVEHPRQLLPEVVWNSRVADLRRQGYKIETRVVGERKRALRGRFTPSGQVEYQYMLVRPEVGK